MRKADLELLEMYLEPLRTAKDRHDESINGVERTVRDLSTQVTEHLRDADSNDLAIKQALATVRSLIQRAHRLTKAELGEEEDEPEVAVDTTPPPLNVDQYREAVRKKVRARTGRGTIL